MGNASLRAILPAGSGEYGWPLTHATVGAEPERFGTPFRSAAAATRSPGRRASERPLRLPLTGPQETPAALLRAEALPPANQHIEVPQGPANRQPSKMRWESGSKPGNLPLDLERTGKIHRASGIRAAIGLQSQRPFARASGRRFRWSVAIIWECLSPCFNDS